ncbi:MAG TPA: HTTM domain-containing protein [Enhygromyxa sp.]|nr:HTTM domain-containing protein [Enhygromyxa sp.]
MIGGLLDRFWLVPIPGLRLAVVRVLICAFALVWLVGFAPILLSGLWFPPERFEPIGVVSLLDAPLAPAIGVVIWLITVIAGVASLIGWRFRTIAPLFAIGLLWVTSYRNSWGMIFHSENLLVMHVLVLALLPAADAWSFDAARDPELRARGRELHGRYGWGARLMATITVLTYVVAGVAKLRNSGTAWLAGEVLLSHVAWDNLRKVELGDLHSPIGAALSAYPAVFVPLAWMSVALELGAPIALLGPRLARVWAAGMWAFHVGVLLIMAIAFVYPLTGVAFAPMFAVEQPVAALADRLRRRRPNSMLARLLPGDPLPS